MYQLQADFKQQIVIHFTIWAYESNLIILFAKEKGTMLNVLLLMPVLSHTFVLKESLKADLSGPLVKTPCSYS